MLKAGNQIGESAILTRSEHQMNYKYRNFNEFLSWYNKMNVLHKAVTHGELGEGQITTHYTGGFLTAD